VRINFTFPNGVNMAISPLARLKAAKLPLIAVTGTVSCCLVLWQARLPDPHIDDLFFIGAAINLTESGELKNPLEPSWSSAMKDGLYHFHPPYYSYILAGWIKIFGISTASLVAYQNFWYLILVLSLIGLCRRLNIPITAAIVSGVFATWILLQRGLRNDATAMAQLSVGLYFITFDRVVAYFCGFFVLGTASLTYPIAAAYAMPMALALLIRNAVIQPWRDWRYWVPRFTALVVAVAAHYALITNIIQSPLQSFVDNFLRHASWRRLPFLQGGAYSFYLQITGGYGWFLHVPTLLLAITATIVTFAGSQRTTDRLRSQIGALAAGIILNILLYTNAYEHVLLFSLVLAILAAFQWPEVRVRRIFIGVVLLTAVSSQYLNILRATLPDSRTAIAYEIVRADLDATNDGVLAIDAYAARYLYDYVLPDNAIDYWFQLTPPDGPPLTPLDKSPEITWVASEGTIARTLPDCVICPRVEFIGRTYNTIPLRPRSIVVLR
jgi:hypothetical protein